MIKLAFPAGIVLLGLAVLFAAYLGFQTGTLFAIGGVALSLATAWSIWAAIEHDVTEMGVLGAGLLVGLVVMFGWYGAALFVVSFLGGAAITGRNVTD